MILVYVSTSSSKKNSSYPPLECTLGEMKGRCMNGKGANHPRDSFRYAGSKMSIYSRP